VIPDTEVADTGAYLKLTKPKDVRETSNANRPHRCLRSRIGFLGLGKSSGRCRSVSRRADPNGHHDRVVGAILSGSKPRIDKWPGFARPFLYERRMIIPARTRFIQPRPSDINCLPDIEWARRNFPPCELFLHAA
jgi:hypothetical protein